MRVRRLFVIPLLLAVLPVWSAWASSEVPRGTSPPTVVYAGPTTRIDWDRIGRDVDLARFYAWASAQPPPKKAATIPATTRIQRVVYGSGACGGDLPPCSVMECESHGNLVAQNPHSTASGKWQILDSTWARYGGYERAMDAPESVQDDRAREVYAGGAGRRAWSC